MGSQNVAFNSSTQQLKYMPEDGQPQVRIIWLFIQLFIFDTPTENCHDTHLVVTGGTRGCGHDDLRWRGPVKVTKLTPCRLSVFSDFLCHVYLCLPPSLATGVAIWRHWPWSTLFQVMVRCVQPPTHQLNRCRLIFNWAHKNKFRRNLNRNATFLS